MMRSALTWLLEEVVPFIFQNNLDFSSFYLRNVFPSVIYYIALFICLRYYTSTQLALTHPTAVSTSCKTIPCFRPIYRPTNSAATAYIHEWPTSLIQAYQISAAAIRFVAPLDRNKRRYDM